MEIIMGNIITASTIPPAKMEYPEVSTPKMGAI